MNWVRLHVKDKGSCDEKYDKDPVRCFVVVVIVVLR